MVVLQEEEVPPLFNHLQISNTYKYSEQVCSMATVSYVTLLATVWTQECLSITHRHLLVICGATEKAVLQNRSALVLEL